MAVADLEAQLVAGLPERGEWERCASAAGHPFALPEWLEAYAAVLGDDVRTVVVGDAEEPLGIVAFARQADGSTGFLGHPLSDCCGPVAAPEHQRRVLHAALHLVGGDPRFRPLVAVGASAEATIDLDPRWDVHAEPAPVVEIGTQTWQEYLAGRRARRRRRIAAEGAGLLADDDVAIAEATSPHEITLALPILVDLHRARFGERQRTFDGARGTFFARALPALASVGAASVRVLSVAGRPAAAILVLHAGGDDWFYQSGWDPALAGRSVGRALFADTVRSAFDRRRGAFRLLHGNDTYKSFWATREDRLITISGS